MAVGRGASPPHNASLWTWPCKYWLTVEFAKLFSVHSSKRPGLRSARVSANIMGNLWGGKKKKDLEANSFYFSLKKKKKEKKKSFLFSFTPKRKVI